MLSVPRALTSKSVLGSASDVVTATWPARWMIASWFCTASGSAAAFLTSSLLNVVRSGYFVISHLRLRSVPVRLRLSRRVTCQPSLTRCWAALTPRKPAPPVIRTRRSASAGVGGYDLVLVVRSIGSIAPDTLAGRYASEEGNRHDPASAGQDQRLATLAAAVRVEVRARQEQDGERSVDEVEEVACGVAAEDQGGQAEQALHRGQPGHDQVGRAEPAAQRLVAEVVIRAPQREQHRKYHEQAGAVPVEEGERGHSGVESSDLGPEILDREAEPFFELDARLPAELLSGAGVVEGDAVHVALATRPILRLELVLGEERELAEEVVHGDRDAGADVVGAAVAALQGREVGDGDVTDVQHVARLVAVAVDGERLAFDHPAGEDGHHAAFLRGEVLARAVDVGVAQARVREAEGPMKGAEVLLEGQLARAVWRERAHRVVLVCRYDVRLSIEGAAG